MVDITIIYWWYYIYNLVYCCNYFFCWDDEKDTVGINTIIFREITWKNCYFVSYSFSSLSWMSNISVRADTKSPRYHRPLINHTRIFTHSWISILRWNRCILVRTVGGKKNYERRKQGRKGIRRIAARSGGKRSVHTPREGGGGGWGGWGGRYLQFRGSIHEQVGDTNLDVRVTFSPRLGVCMKRRMIPRSVIGRTTTTTTSRATPATFVTTLNRVNRAEHAWLRIQLNLHTNTSVDRKTRYEDRTAESK